MLAGIVASSVLKASGKLMRGRTFVFTCTNQAPINQGPAVYIWGVDRNGNLPAGPFEGRPNVRFDALIIVGLDASLTPTPRVIDLATGSVTALPASSVRIRGATIRVMLAASLLPSTGLAPSQYRFNYWPEDGGPPISAVSQAPPSGSAPHSASRLLIPFSLMAALNRADRVAAHMAR